MSLVMAEPNWLVDDDDIAVLQAQLGGWDNLNHLIVCKRSKVALIIDPFDGDYWQQICHENSWNLTQAWLTHSHWDHCKGIGDLNDGVKIWVHELEEKRGWEGGDTDRWKHLPLTKIIQKIGELEFEIHCTPGHTPGHVTIIGNGLVVSGDCMFLGRCGRTDLFGGDVNMQRSSLQYLKGLLEKLQGNELVLPGHQYTLPDGSTPTTCTVSDLLTTNEALLAVDDKESFMQLEFLSFDDSLAERARRQKAMEN